MGFGPQPHFEALLAFLDGEPAGMALFHPRFSTWLGQPRLFLEDLYVTEAARGHGVGRRLMARLAAIAIERGWGRHRFSRARLEPGARLLPPARHGPSRRMAALRRRRRGARTPRRARIARRLITSTTARDQSENTLSTVTMISLGERRAIMIRSHGSRCGPAVCLRPAACFRG